MLIEHSLGIIYSTLNYLHASPNWFLTEAQIWFNSSEHWGSFIKPKNGAEPTLEVA